MHALDLVQHLKPVWHSEDDAFVDFATLMAGSGRILAVTFRGELFLLGRNGSALEVTSKLKLFEGDSEMYSHPALAGHRLFVRDRRAVGCLELEDGSDAGLAAALGNHP